MTSAEQTPRPRTEQDKEYSIKELQTSLLENGWEIAMKDEPDKHVLLGRRYSTVNNHILQDEDWLNAVVNFYERGGTPPENCHLLAGQTSTENERIVFLQIDVNNRTHLMHALELDRWLRDWGFEDRNDSARQHGLSA